MTDLRDPATFNAEYRRLSPLALAAANRVLRDEAAAEDVVQDVFMHLWRRPSTYDPARGTLRSFVVMLTRSRALDRWRSNAAERGAVERAGGELRVGRGAAESCAEPVILRDRTRRTLAAVATLPPPQRDAVLLAGLGLSSAEIARRSAVPVSTAKSRVRLGLDKVRERAADAA